MPHTIHRKHYDIHEISKWKSSEIKNFLFYQSIPIFLNIFNNREQINYLYKYISYVIDIRILLQSNIDIIYSIRILIFVIKFYYV